MSRWRPEPCRLSSIFWNVASQLRIATAAGKTNVEYFIRKFDLLAYFARRAHRLQRRNNSRKARSRSFLEAMRRLGTEDRNTTVFEDSYAGIQAAQNAHAGNIIIVNSNNELPFSIRRSGISTRSTGKPT